MVLRSRRRRRTLARLYKSWLGPGSLAFDVGANVGQKTRAMLSAGARVVAFEPQPSCLESLAEIHSERLVVEPVALGSERAELELHIASAHTISSMATGWIDAVQRSGRFAGYAWPDTISVPVATLDEMIEKHGLPDFCKIDVEGYEPEVLTGLSRPIPVVSFEFTPEWLTATVASLDRLDALGFGEFNLSLGESNRLHWPGWRPRGDVEEALEAFVGDSRTFGDVYARSRSATSTSGGTARVTQSVPA